MATRTFTASLLFLCFVVTGCPPQTPAGDDGSSSGNTQTGDTQANNTQNTDTQNDTPGNDSSQGGNGDTKVLLPDGVLGVRIGANGAKNGTSWEDAFTDLQQAIAAALVPGSNVREIWVAAGTYKPAGPGGDRNTSFTPVNDVTIFGGFAGTETKLTDRNIAANPTILSGDLNGNDAPGFANRQDNARLVVSARGLKATAVLDGFTITAGESTGFGAGYYGDQGGDVTIKNCTFVDNHASQGAALALIATKSASLEGCVFRDNLGLGVGGAISSYLASDLNVLNCAFDNDTASEGGAVQIDSNNKSAKFTACVFRSNDAQRGGAISYDGTSLELQNCVFTENTASDMTSGGGAILCKGKLSAYNCEFRSNTGRDGGAIHCQADGLALAGCLFTGNQATFGGGLFDNGNSPRLTNCTFSANTAGSEAGGVFLLKDQWLIYNCILWGNSDINGMKQGAQIFLGSPPILSLVKNCDIQGLSTITGTGNISLDPLFVDAAAGNFRLQAASPCIGTGDASILPNQLKNDLDGNLRVLGMPPALDMGAYEQ